MTGIMRSGPGDLYAEKLFITQPVLSSVGTDFIVLRSWEHPPSKAIVQPGSPLGSLDDRLVLLQAVRVWLPIFVPEADVEDLPG